MDSKITGMILHKRMENFEQLHNNMYFYFDIRYLHI